MKTLHTRDKSLGTQTQAFYGSFLHVSGRHGYRRHTLGFEVQVLKNGSRPWERTRSNGAYAFSCYGEAHT